MTTRLLNASPTSPTPKNSVEWHRLMMQVIARAQTTGARHLPGLRQAVASGQIETTLRRMGILSSTDIEREFPAKS